jgi:hypothetical protein
VTAYPDLRRWQPGDSIAVRDVYEGRILAAVAVVVVEDTPERLLAWLPEGSPLFLPADAQGRLVKSVDFDHLAELRWNGFGGGPLYLFPWGEPFMFRATWDGSGPGRALDHWYVNLQTPPVRTSIGLDTHDHILDVIIQPDLTTWAWKDDEQFEAAVTSGRFSTGGASGIRAAGLRAVEMARNREPPFSEGWEEWLPDPTWRVPMMPEDWKRL